MHLKSLTLKGFKSFPERTSLVFDAGVSVVVGPNGSGKSNVTDAVLWALGEQSPLAVRGQSMQDVIFGGGRGRPSSASAEVELVLDNSDRTLEWGGAEISILRRLDRTGEGEYRLGGTRCRLVDVLEVLSDTGLGKEMHSVISQGRVESLVTSKPRERRLLIEEAAGLGKHRKRRRRAELKLVRTRENVDRALDVEREARSRLRPLKRQAEAAELHERLERQALEARWSLSRDDARARRSALLAAAAEADGARRRRDEREVALRAVAERRQAAEDELASRVERQEALSGRVFGARGAADRLALRREGLRAGAEALGERVARRRAEIEALEAATRGDRPDPAGAERVAALEAERSGLERDRAAERAREVAELEARHATAAGALEQAEALLGERRAAVAAAQEAAEAARSGRRAAERAHEEARRESARIGAELASVGTFLRLHGERAGAARTLADALEVAPGYEQALAAALGARLSAAIVSDLPAGAALLERAGERGASALVAGGVEPGGARARGPAPVPEAEPLRDRVSGPSDALALAAPVLADAWVVPALAAVPPDFAGIAVTRTGHAYFGAGRELRRLPAGGEERVLAERNRRAELVAATERSASAEEAARRAVKRGEAAVRDADVAGDREEQGRRDATRARDAAAEEERRAAWLLEARRTAPDEGPAAARRARLDADLAAERRLAERAQRERGERAARLERLRDRLGREEALVPALGPLVVALEHAGEAIAVRTAAFEREWEADRAAGHALAARLRACAQEEAGRQEKLRELGEQVTGLEVRAQRARDASEEAETDLNALAEQLGLSAEPAAEPLPDGERGSLAARLERLSRRRAQLGPVNPLAAEEYTEALGHVEELERQREDLEAALRELARLVRETDRQIRETFEATFEATARHFEELAGQLFPGGRGRLRLVREDAGPRPVLGGGPTPVAYETETGAPPEGAAQPAGESDEDRLGVELEITPAGKATKRLSLLSGGEKSLTALAFIFAVLLARPCPFYILDEVEAALDDPNIGRFLELLRRYAGRTQFIVVTHQKRTMEAADCLYGVSMGDDGVSKVVSRRLPPAAADAA